MDSDNEDLEETESSPDDPFASKTLRVRAIVAELDFLKEVVGDMSKFTRQAIRNELERRGIEVPEGFFFERPPGNWTKGEHRRGKENRLTGLNHQAGYNKTAAILPIAVAS